MAITAIGITTGITTTITITTGMAMTVDITTADMAVVDWAAMWPVYVTATERRDR